MKRTLLNGVLIGACIIGGLASCGNNKVDPLADGVLTIGLECAYSPYNFTEYSQNENNIQINGTNEYCGGYDILIANEIAKDLGVRVEVVRCEWDGLIPQLQSGAIDAIIAGMTDTPERRNSIDFTDEYYSSQLVIVTNRANASATQVSDFTGKKLVAQLGTVQADLIISLAESDGIIAANPTVTYPEAFTALQAGTVDGVVCERPVATDFLASSLGEGYQEVVMEGNNDFIVSVSIGISKNAVSTYKDQLNASLAKISTARRTELMNIATGAN